MSDTANSNRSSINDGGPAFPQCEWWSKPDGSDATPELTGGMSLRDWFAGMFAAQAAKSLGEYADEEVANDAYAMADAMLAARENGGDA